ncbi:MAG: nucleotidyltransferase domain-containing protein [Nanoarchaeota archaeon]|nr:nucleotidyltransferase domain-containing protein [Nanoarchaeota archaeon]
MPENNNDSMENALKNAGKNDYQPNVPNEIPDDVKKEMEKTKTKLDSFTKEVLKKYKSVVSISVIAPQAQKIFEDEDQMTKEEIEVKPIHTMILIPEDNFKEIKKIKKDLVEMGKKMTPPLWVHIGTPVDVFNYALDSKYEFVSAIAMSYPLFDNGFLGGLRAAEIHKSLVLRKFDKYITSYGLYGSLVRGEATKTSDVDLAIIIDDTDVKRMPRLELREKLRGIINSYIVEAEEMAGVKNKLNIQVWLLTEFWDGVKDANPIFFTFLRDGIPLYDRGTFMPWKLLLKMGKLKPSPEAIDSYMAAGEKTVDMAKRRILDIAILDLYWGIVNPTQAIFMMMGLPPPVPKYLVSETEKVFVKKEKLLEGKYIKHLERIVQLYKDYEHQKVKEISGKDLDEMISGFDEYMKRLLKLEKQILGRMNERTVEQVYADGMSLLKSIFGNKKEEELVKMFEKNLVNQGKFAPNFLSVLNDLIKAHKDKKKMKTHEIESVRKNATVLINHLVEYNQRCDLAELDKGRMKLKFKDKSGELILVGDRAFLSIDSMILEVQERKLVDVSQEQFQNIFSEGKGKEVKFGRKVFDLIKKEYGEFSVVL